jgi:hypothetical protein
MVEKVRKQEKRKVGRPATGHKSSSDRNALVRIERTAVERARCADPDRRARLEADPVAWLRHYLAGTYSRPFEKPHLEIVAGVVKAHETGGRFIVAAERGIGKSAILWGMILYLALSGRQRYPVCVPWAAPALKRAFRFWKNALSFNAALASDYPEFCAPFRHARGVAQRVMTTTWRDTGEPCGCQLTVGDGMIVLPDRLGCIGGATINGNIRGLNHPQDDGTVLRPSIALLDDVQDRQTAKSPAQVADTCAIIDGDVAGCGEPGRDLPLLMACNCIAPGDVSEHYLLDPGWISLRVPCVESWPEGWDDENSEAVKLWDRWYELFLRGKGCELFYEKHKAVMTEGMVLSAPAAFIGADKCPDAFFGVMRMYFRMGHEAFMAERQQAPIDPAKSAPYTLTREKVLAHVTKRAAWVVPEGVHLIVAGADINPAYGITWAVVGFEGNHTAHVLSYGVDALRLRQDWSEAQKMAGVFGGLAALRARLCTTGARPRLMAFDVRGWNRDHALSFGAQSERDGGLLAIPAQGTGWKAYRPSNRSRIGDPREGCHMAADPSGKRRFMVVHSDYWREIMQLAFATAPGAPGSCDLPAGSHQEFCDQLLSEPLIEKKAGALGMEWLYVRKPGRNDYSDAMVMAYAGAAMAGIGTGGTAGRSVVRSRRPSVQMVKI